MVRLMIVADDFTGALDSGVKFAAHGARTLVVVGMPATFSPDAEVLVVDAETRHLAPERAYEIIGTLTAGAIAAGIPYIYKKTDSALRGNVGAELTALLKASGARQLPFLPAFPQVGRTTVDGIHRSNGTPVAESVFGRDPFEPVRHSSVTELIGEQSDVPAHSFPALGPRDQVPDQEGILVFDGERAEDLVSTGERLLAAGMLRVAAGCAGFAAVLPRLLGFGTAGAAEGPALDPRMLVVCGSVNPITAAQIRYAEAHGFQRIQPTPQQKLEPDYWDTPDGAQAMDDIRRQLRQSPRLIIDTNEPDGNSLTAGYAASLGLTTQDVRVRVAKSFGRIVGELFTDPALGTLFITGGDTLLQCMQAMGVSQMEPVCELDSGVVLSRFTYRRCTRYVISKSGGFGGEDLLVGLAGRLGSQQTN